MVLFSPAPCSCCPSSSQKAAACTFLQGSLGWATGMLWTAQLWNSSRSQERTHTLAKHKASLCQGLASHSVVSDGKAIQIWWHFPYLLCYHYAFISFWGQWTPRQQSALEESWRIPSSNSISTTISVSAPKETISHAFSYAPHTTKRAIPIQCWGSAPGSDRSFWEKLPFMSYPSTRSNSLFLAPTIYLNKSVMVNICEVLYVCKTLRVTTCHVKFDTEVQ